MHFHSRLCIILIIPLVTVNLGKSILPVHGLPALVRKWVLSTEKPSTFHDPPNHTSSQSPNRTRRDTADSAMSVSLFGVSFEYDVEQRNVAFTDGFIAVLEQSEIGMRLFGIFTPGSKLMLSKSGLNCDDESKEYNIMLEELVSKSSSHVKQPFSHTFGRVEKLLFPTKAEYPKVYFCIWDPSSQKWEPQGSGKAIQIELMSKAMPIWMEIILIIFLLCLSGLFSGLNLGLMSLNKTDLKIIINTGTPLEREYAAKIAPVRNHGNFLLCCLLFSNVLVNATLTILMDGLTSGPFAIVLSTLAIVVFGEIIPQAICSRHGLAVGAKTIYITKFFMLLTFPLAYPLSKVLDKLLGEEIGSVYTRERLKELLRVTKDHHGLETEEVALISGALDMKTKTVRDIMTKLDTVFMLPLETNLDYDTISEIEFQGYTRIPVYDKIRSNVVAVLNVKQLTLLDASDNIPMRTVVEYYQNSLFYVFENTRLDYMFRAFREGNRGHMAFVQRINDDGPGDPFYETIGVVTMEDVLEELLQADILDETDVGKFKSRLETRDKRRDIPFLSKKRSTPAISVPPPLALAACQFLSTLAKSMTVTHGVSFEKFNTHIFCFRRAVDAFNRQHISENILSRLVKTTVTIMKPPKFQDKELQKPVYLYEFGKPSDLFVMILEGRVDVEVGREKLAFQAGPFQCFGAGFLSAKLDPNSEKDSVPLDSALIRKHHFVPDYSIRIVSETFYMKVRFSAYRAARVATELERMYSSDPKAALSNQNWRKEVEDILTVVDEDLFKHHRRMLYNDPQDENSDSEPESNATTALLNSRGTVNGSMGDMNRKVSKDDESIPSVSIKMKNFHEIAPLNNSQHSVDAKV